MIRLTCPSVNHLLLRTVIFTRELVNRPTITAVALCQKNSKFDTFYWALRWLNSIFTVTVDVLSFFCSRRHSESNVTGHGASYFAIELQGLNVDQISSSVMNVFVLKFVLKFLFMTDSIYLQLITTFLNPSPPQKIKCQNRFQLYRFLGNYIYFLASSSLIALLNWLISIWLHVGFIILLWFCRASRYARVIYGYTVISCACVGCCMVWHNVPERLVLACCC